VGTGRLRRHTDSTDLPIGIHAREFQWNAIAGGDTIHEDGIDVTCRHFCSSIHYRQRRFGCLGNQGALISQARKQ
jgi:hypothetical protein